MSHSIIISEQCVKIICKILTLRVVSSCFVLFKIKITKQELTALKVGLNKNEMEVDILAPNSTYILKSQEVKLDPPT